MVGASALHTHNAKVKSGNPTKAGMSNEIARHAMFAVKVFLTTNIDITCSKCFIFNIKLLINVNFTAAQNISYHGSYSVTACFHSGENTGEKEGNGDHITVKPT